MHILEKVKWSIAILAIVLGLIWFVLPSLQESKRTMKIKSFEIEDYIKNSKEIALKIDDIQIIKTEKNIPFRGIRRRHSADTKSSLLLKYKPNDKYYLIESYHHGIQRINIENVKDSLYLMVNPLDTPKGSKEDPFVALRYYEQTKYSDYEVNDEQYLENVKKYLSYKEFTPTSNSIHFRHALILLALGLGYAFCAFIQKRQL